MDGIGGTIKHRIYRDIKSGKVIIKNAKHFSTYAGITSLYMSVDEVLKEPENIVSSPKIPGTLKVYKIARFFTNDGVCKLDFYQWYKKEGDTDVCSHAELPLAYNPDQICAQCYGIYVQGQE